MRAQCGVGTAASRSMLFAAAVLAGTFTSAQDARRWAYQRHSAAARDCGRYLAVPGRPAPVRRFGDLKPEQVLAACETMAREMAADLADPALDVRSRTATLSHLEALGRGARPAVPAILAGLDDHDDDPDKFVRVSTFCHAAEALGAADPKNPDVIRALSKAVYSESTRAGCPRCGCALQALARAGPAAAPIAGPVIGLLPDRDPALAAHLDRTIQALGLPPRRSAVAAGPSGPPPVPTPVPPGKKLSIDERIARLRALAANAGQLGSTGRRELEATAAAYLGERYAPLRVAGAEAAGAVGRLDLLAPALRDVHYEVRRAALGGLAAAGPRASPFAGQAIDALDPYLGTAEAAAKALVAMGRGIAPEVERRGVSAAVPLRPLFEATARAVGSGDMAPVQGALARGFKKGPRDTGYVRIESLSRGTGTRYDAAVHRIQVEVSGGVYGPGREGAAPIAGRITADNTGSNVFFSALQGQPMGERLRLLMSPETALSPFTYTQHKGGDLPPGAAGEFEVEIRKVCQPQVWELTKGGGILGPIRIETSCK
jgi:hypothetical protein